MIAVARDKTIDIAKGIGIILVVIGHLIGSVGSESAVISWFKGFLYQFHVPLFFFISGILFNRNEKWASFMVKKIKRLYIPFLLSNLIFLFIDIQLRVFCDIHIIPLNEIKHTVKIVLQMCITAMGGATWFLIALFRAAITYKLILWIFHDNRFIAVIICSIIAIFGVKYNYPYYWGPTMVALFFFSIGDISKPIINKLYSSNSRTKVYLCIISAVILVILKSYNSFDVSQGKYQNILLALISSLLGIIMIFSISNLFSAYLISGFISTLGSSSMSILIGHFISFKLITFLQVLFTDAPTTALLSHPCYNISGAWPFLYLIAGIVIPLMAKGIWTKANHHLTLLVKNKCP